MIFLSSLKKCEKVGGEKREREGEKEHCSTVVCIILMSVTYSTDTDVKTVVRRSCDIDVTVYRLFSGLCVWNIDAWCRDPKVSLCVYVCLHISNCMYVSCVEHEGVNELSFHYATLCCITTNK